MNIKLDTFLQLLDGYVDEPGDIRSFLDECLPEPSEHEIEAVQHALNPVLPIAVYVTFDPTPIVMGGGWVVG